MAARAAIAKMIRDGYVCICTINKILKMSGGIPDRRDYEILHTLHCVHFNEMEPELLRGLPVIITRVLNSKGLDFNLGPEYRGKLLGI